MIPARACATCAPISGDLVPHRRDGEHLQVLAITNFKGGSGKTTTAAHLAQYLALQGYRVLAVDLDPQASLSALLGVLPETDVGANETLYAAIRYDDPQRPLKDAIRPTYFDRGQVTNRDAVHSVMLPKPHSGRSWKPVSCNSGPLVQPRMDNLMKAQI